MPLRRHFALVWALLLAPILLMPGAMAEPVGSVARVQGHVEAVEGTQARTLSVGATVERGEVLRTGDRARLEFRLADGTQVVLGEGAEMVVDAFAYDAQARTGNAQLRLIQGAFLLDSGAIAKLPGRPLSVRTPMASIGLRGTRFWGGPLDGPFNVLLIEGAISVATAAGAVEMGLPGTGTTLTRGDAPPSTPIEWGEPRIQRAFATVSFER